MPRLITDDAPRRLRGVWLGPKGVRWPVDWTFAQWGVFAALTIACPLAIFSAFVFLNWYLAISNGLLWGPVAAYFLTKRVMRFVDYDRPLRFWFRQIRGEWKRSMPTPDTTRLRVHCDDVSVADLAHVLRGGHLFDTVRMEGGEVDATTTAA
jgi:hypothetical protein